MVRINGSQGRLLVSVLFIIFGVVLALVRPFAGLDETGHIMLGTVIATLTVWIFQPGSGTYIVGAAMVFLGGMFADIPMPDLATGFSSASLWLMIPAMYLGTALMKTGLGKRLVLSLFKRLNLTYARILGGWFVVGILFALITPSSTVRFLISTPIAVSMADACRLEKGSKGRSLIIISCWVLNIYPSIAWMNGSLFGPAFTSFLPEGLMREMATADVWLRVMAPWLLLSVLFVVVLYFVLRPDAKLTITKEQIRHMYDELGPMDKAEKGCLATLILIFACLIAQLFLPFTTNQALFAALALLFILGVLSDKDVSSGINWDIIIFFGVVMSFAHIFDISGLTAWISPFLASLMRPIAFSPLVFVLALFGICVLIRFLDVSQGWISSAILALATPMLFSDYGLHPLISIMAFVSASNVFFFRYAQPWVVQVESVCGDSGWNPKHLSKASFVYLGVAAVTLVFCRFYWVWIGIL